MGWLPQLVNRGVGFAQVLPVHQALVPLRGAFAITGRDISMRLPPQHGDLYMVDDTRVTPAPVRGSLDKLVRAFRRLPFMTGGNPTNRTKAATMNKGNPYQWLVEMGGMLKRLDILKSEGRDDDCFREVSDLENHIMPRVKEYSQHYEACLKERRDLIDAQKDNGDISDEEHRNRVSEINTELRFSENVERQILGIRKSKLKVSMQGIEALALGHELTMALRDAAQEGVEVLTGRDHYQGETVDELLKGRGMRAAFDISGGDIKIFISAHATRADILEEYLHYGLYRRNPIYFHAHSVREDRGQRIDENRLRADLVELETQRWVLEQFKSYGLDFSKDRLIEHAQSLQMYFKRIQALQAQLGMSDADIDLVYSALVCEVRANALVDTLKAVRGIVAGSLHPAISPPNLSK